MSALAIAPPSEAAAAAAPRPEPPANLRSFRRVAVLRALMLGDMLCATPALRALRDGLPHARITLIGLPWAAELASRLSTVDDFLVLPAWPGLPETGHSPDGPEMLRFLHRARAAHFDLVVQLHGSGAVTNRIVGALAARTCAGFADVATTVPEGQSRRFIGWPAEGSESHRLLRLTDHLGLTRRGDGLELPIRATDRRAAAELRTPLRGRPYAVLHPGARWASRRWPAARFAEVGGALAARGLSLVITGSAAEAELAAGVARACVERAAAAPAGSGAVTRSTAAAPVVLDVSGRTSLWALGALVEQARLVVCNDTGVSHVAAAVGTPSVVVASGSDVERWRPADVQRHRVLWHPTACRPCSHTQCPIGHPCAHTLAAAAVTRAALQLAAQAR